MTRRLQRRPATRAATSSRITPARLAAVSLVVILAGTAATWSATSGGPISRIVTAPNPQPAATYGPDGGGYDADSGQRRTPDRNLEPGASPNRAGDPTAPSTPGASGAPSRQDPRTPNSGSTSSGPCRVGVKLVPTCGVLWGVAPGAFTAARGASALRTFEAKTGRSQAIYHAYHRGTGQVFPTPAEIALAREPGKPRILFLNWKPTGASWAKIAKGDAKTHKFLDRLAAHINKKFPEQFFLTIHHEAEDQVKEKRGSGYTASDYAAMYRHVVKRLRAKGVDNIVTVVVHMAYVPFTSTSWFPKMYPGDDVVDWIGWDTYAYSDPGYGHGDFAELMNRTSARKPNWPGFYNWAATRHPNKPLMVAEWGVWQSKKNPHHKAEFYRSVGRQIGRFPRIKALVHFDTPHNQEGRDSRVDSTKAALQAYRELGRMSVFQVQVRPTLP